MQNGNGREVVIVEAARTPIGRGHPEKGYYKDTHPNELLGKTYTEVIERAGIDASEVEDVISRLRAAVRRADVQRRPQRLAAGRPAGRDARHHGRPPVRLGAAGRQLRRRPDRLRRARRGDRLGRRAHGPHPDGDRLQVGRRRRLALAAGADGEVQPRPAGDLGRDDRRQVGDPALRARRDRRALAPERASRDRGGPLRARDRPLPGQRQHLRDRSGHPPGLEPRDALPAEAGLQGGRQDHRRQLVADLRRRRRGAADGAGEGGVARPQAARQGASTRRPSASTP